MSTTTAPTRHSATIDELAAQVGVAVGHPVSPEDLRSASWSRHVKVMALGPGAGGRTVFAVDDDDWIAFIDALR
jgi:hypothetical protein